MKALRRALALIGLVLAAGSALADVAVIELRHRPAAELLPLVEPMTPAETVVRGDGSRLVVRGTPERIEAVRALVEQLDTRPEALRISLRIGSETVTGRAGAEIAGDGDERGETGSVRVHGTRDATARDRIQTVRAVAGRPAFIDTGGTLLLTERTIAVRRRGAAIDERYRRMDWPDGFLATARVDGDRVTVTLRADRADPPRPDTATERQRIVTTVAGPLGQWIPVAAVSEQGARTGSGITRRSSDARDRRRTVELRVTRIDP